MHDLLDVTRRSIDPEPPADIWDGFEEELERRISRADRHLTVAFERWGRRIAGLAAVLVVGFGLGAVATRVSAPELGQATSADREVLLADLQAELRNDARLESYLAEIEDLLVSYRATEHGDAVDLFRRSVPATMVAGPAISSETDRHRLEQQRAAREQLRSVVLGMLTSEIESERRGFDYLDRRIAAIAGRELLYFVP